MNGRVCKRVLVGTVIAVSEEEVPYDIETG